MATWTQDPDAGYDQAEHMRPGPEGHLWRGIGYGVVFGVSLYIVIAAAVVCAWWWWT